MRTRVSALAASFSGFLSILTIGIVAAAPSSFPATAAAQTRQREPIKKALSKAARAPVPGPIDPSPIPIGWTCAGNCGTDAADGVVTLSPTGNPAYEWVSTAGGVTGVGVLPNDAQGSETDGSTLSTPIFSATAGTPLNFYFNYVTSDGAFYADYAWAELYNSANVPVALLFTARTETSGSIIPGTALPQPMATLTPASVPIISGGPAWQPIAPYSGECFDAGCGYTGWVQANYVIPTTGNYYLKVGVVNWIDQLWDSGLAVDGVTIGGAPITVLSGNLEVEYGTDAAKTAWLALATSSDTAGKPLNMQSAATMMGFDHFNWLQIITGDLQLQACAANPALSGCADDFTITGAVPPIPTADPPAGGYTYELCPSGVGCQSSFPAQDFWPMYLDEYFASVPNTDYYVASPASPEYVDEYRAGNTLAQMGATGQSPSTALGFSFSDAPNTTFTVPGTKSTTESISFVDALVGVKGACNVLVSSNCQFQIIPGTTFKWTAESGVVSPTLTPGGPGTPAAALLPVQSSSIHDAKHLVNFPKNPIDLTGDELADSVISVEQFLELAKLTPDGLAKLGGSISIFSASLIPSEAAALAAANQKVATTTTLSANPSSNLVTGEHIVVTAVVKPVSGTGVPSGTITFSNPATKTTQMVTLDQTGKAVFNTVVPSPAGSFTLLATYGGSSSYKASASAADTFTVKDATVTSISSSPAANLKAGKPLVVTALVQPVSGTAVPTGTVTFSSPSSKATQVVTLDQTGRAILNTIVPPAGTYTLVATYNGSSASGGSVSAPATEVVTGP